MNNIEAIEELAKKYIKVVPDENGKLTYTGHKIFALEVMDIIRHVAKKYAADIIIKESSKTEPNY